MTMADLEQLLREHVPESGVCIQERGRAGVTNGALRIDLDRGHFVTPPVDYWRRYRKCPECGNDFQPTRATRQRYCSNACKQKAYRRRKKQKAA